MNATEFEAQLTHARMRMAEAGLDALLLAGGPNLFYFTGLPHGRSGSRPYILIIPTFGDPILIVHQARQYEAHRFSHVRDIRTYAGLSYAPVSEIAAVLTQRGTRRMGLEMSQEHYLDLQVSDLDALHATLPGSGLRRRSGPAVGSAQGEVRGRGVGHRRSLHHYRRSLRADIRPRALRDDRGAHRRHDAVGDVGTRRRLSLGVDYIRRGQLRFGEQGRRRPAGRTRRHGVDGCGVYRRWVLC